MITPNDIPGFFSDINQLNKKDFIFIDYFFESPIDPKLAAASLASEQSTAQWKRIGINEDLRETHGAKIVDLKIIKESPKPLYEFPWIKGNHFSHCKVKVAHPIINFGPHIPNLMSAIAGEGPFYCPGITSIKVMDLHLPDSFISQFQGPQFGISGLREKFKIFNRPFFIGVVKPNIGLSHEDFADLAYQSWLGGLDIAKDDEMLANAPYSKLSERISTTTLRKSKAEEETKTPKALLANITDENDQLLKLYDQAEQAGANIVMINTFFTGMSSLRVLRKESRLPIMSHFTGMAISNRMTHYGIHGKVFVKLQRLAGADFITMPGFGERMQITEEEVLENIQACTENMASLKKSLPVPGGSDWAGTLPKVYDKISHHDFGFIAGRGVYGHPDGPQAGARSLHQAWDAISSGKNLEDYSEKAIELKNVLEAWSS